MLKIVHSFIEQKFEIYIIIARYIAVQIVEKQLTSLPIFTQILYILIILFNYKFMIQVF